MRSMRVMMARRLGIHEGGQGARGKKDASMDLSGGVNTGTIENLEQHWQVVFISIRTARLELTEALDAAKS